MRPPGSTGTTSDGCSLVTDQDPAPTLHQVVLDATDARGLAEFYRALLGWTYRAGDERPAPGQPDPRGQDWLVLRNPGGGIGLAFQQVHDLLETTWPSDGVPQQAHLDMTVRSVDELETQHARVLALGGRLRYDRSDDPVEPLRVYADPAGHLLCIFVVAE